MIEATTATIAIRASCRTEISASIKGALTQTVGAAPDRAQCCSFAMDGIGIWHPHHACFVSTSSCSDFRFFGLLRGYNTTQTLEVRASRLVEACVHFGYNKLVNGRGGSHHETGCYRIA